MSKEAKLGLFVLVVFTVFLVFTINMGSGLLAGRKMNYPVYFTNIGTLEKGAPVKQAGFDIGEVVKIAPVQVMEPTPTFYVVVDISVSDTAYIAYDSFATIQTLGMMGEKYLEITYGTLEKAPPGTRLEGRGPQQLDQVIEGAVGLISEIERIVRSLNVIFGDQAFQKNITDLIANLEQISVEINQLFGGEERRLEKILKNTQIASANLNSLIATAEIFVSEAQGLLDESRPHITQTLKNTSDITHTLKTELPDSLHTFKTQLTHLSEQLEQSLENADRLIAKLELIVDDSRPDVQKALDNITEFTTNAKTATEQVNSFLGQIEKGEGLVHDIIYDPELSRSAKHTIRQASDVMSNITSFGDKFSFELDARYFPDSPRFDFDDNNIRADLGIRFSMTDRLSLFMGANSVGSSNNLEAQLGYHLGAFTFHGGVIESEFGIGLDWQIVDRWMVGVEGIGLTDEQAERLDAYSEFLLWRNLYLVGGVQDITDDFFPNVGMKMSF